MKASSLKKLALLNLGLIAFLLCPSGQALESSAPSSKTTTSLAQQDSAFIDELPDFSMVGYHHGSKERPQGQAQFPITKFGAKANDDQDDSGAIQKAIDKASKSGGVVVIPEGRWLIKKVLEIRQSHVILRGAGSGKSILEVPQSLADLYGKKRAWSWSGAFIRINPFRGRSAKLGVISKNTKAGLRSFTVKALSKERPKKGEWLELQWHNDKGSDSLLDHIYQGLIPKKRMGEELQEATGPRVREWVQVDTVQGDQWTLKRPLLLDVRPEWRPTLVRRQSIQEVGVEGLSMEFPKTKYPGHLKEAGYNGLAMSLAVHCWVKDFKVRNGDSGLFLSSCAYVTAKGVTLSGRRMHHPISLSWTSHCLVEDWRIEAPHRHGTTLSWGAHGNVFSKGWGQNLAMDCHRALPFQNLHTEVVTVQGSEKRVNPLRSGGSAPRGPHSGGGNIYWNLKLQFDKKAPKTVRVTGHSQWPGGLFYGWHGNRRLDFRPVQGLQQRFPHLNQAPPIPNLYHWQRAQTLKKRRSY